MDTLRHDLRYAARTFFRTPGFTTVAILAVALGVGGTTAIFSLVYAVLIEPLPFRDSARLVRLSTAWDSGFSGAVSPANFQDWKARNQVCTDMAATGSWNAALTGTDDPQRLSAAMTTANLFSVLGVDAMLGRTFSSDDERPGHHHVVVLSHGLWKRRFAADRAIVGREIQLNNQPYTVIGVMPASFTLEGDDLWVPSPWGVPVHPLLPEEDPRPMRDRHFLDVYARLQPSVSLAQARSQMDGVARQLAREYAASDEGSSIALDSLRDHLVGNVRPTLLVLFAAVGFVLLIACANVANLLLARIASRSREISLRFALGASHWRIARQLLTESVLLSLAGGILGILFASWAIPALLVLSPSDITASTHIGLNLPVLIFTLLISIATGIGFGMLPALHSGRVPIGDALKEGGRSSGSLGRARARSVLMASEIALSLVLLIGAGLMARSFARLAQVHPGFDPSRVLVFDLAPFTNDPQHTFAFYTQVLERLRTLPGAEQAGAVSRLPLSGGNSSKSLKLKGSSEDDFQSDYRVALPGYFETVGIPLRRGRTLRDSDRPGSPLVAVVNEAFVQKNLGGQPPLGKTFSFDDGKSWIEIVGVVGNIHYLGLEITPGPETYVPLAQAHWYTMQFAVRSRTADPLSLAPAVQAAVHNLDRNVPVAHLRTMQSLLDRSMQRRRYSMTLLCIFAGMAVVLASIGLYGTISYVVSQRTHEIGIRMALGARQSDIRRMVVMQGARLAALGVVTGLLATVLLTRLMARLLFGVGAMDPPTYAAVTAFLVSVALFASYIPARRATRVDPIVALRYE